MLYSLRFVLLAAIANITAIRISLLLRLFLLMLLLLFESETNTVHPHYHRHVLNMMHVLNLLRPKLRQHFLYPRTQQLQTLLIRVRHHKTIHMHQRVLIRYDMLVIIHQHVQKFNSIDWQIHVDVVGLLEINGELVMLFVYSAHSLTSTHVPAYHLRLDFVYLTVQL